MPKTRIPSLIRNLRIELVVDDDDPSKFQVFANYDILDEDGTLLNQGRQEVVVDTSKHSNAVELIEEVIAAVMDDHELTAEDVQTGKQRAEQRRLDQAAAQEQRRQEREAEIAAAAEELKQRHAPNTQREIEEAMQRMIDQHVVIPVPDPDIPTPIEVLEDLLQKELAEKERLLQEQIEAGEAYEQEQAEAEKNLTELRAEDIRRNAESEGAPVRPETPPRRPRR